mmetsp:Transcript_21393/g.40081  ORF Transcript_21393/g.40081 Transcript_21393/m.40081 type:complete len:212 (-) Transcript_21393:361-996(-)
MVEDADPASNLSNLLDLGSRLSILDEISRIGEDSLLAFRHRIFSVLINRFNTNNLIALKMKLFDGLVQHVDSSMHGAQPGESFWETTQSPDGVNVRRIPITGHGIGIKLGAFNRLIGWLSFVALVQVKTNGVSNKLLDIVSKLVIFVNFRHRCLGTVHLIWPGFRVLLIVLDHEIEERLKTVFLQHSQERRTPRITSAGRNLENLSLLVHE